MTATLPDPGPRTDVAGLILEYLDFYRAAVVRKVGDLDDEAFRAPVVPSGWSPAELVKHLAFMERRWLRWGFTGEDVGDPWGDHDLEDGGSPETARWHVAPDESAGDLVSLLLDGGVTTRAIVEASTLDQPAATGGRFPADREPPTLLAILFHVLQEYARHAGHLDVARELIDGATGE
jgi:uncharacterized damage-inducible protein DinB